MAIVLCSVNSLLILHIIAVITLKLSIIDTAGSPYDNNDVNCTCFREKTLFRDPRAFPVCVFVDSVIRASQQKLKYENIYRQKLVLLYLASLLLSNSYAPEPNPGPTNQSINVNGTTETHSSWLCGTCDCTVNWSDKGLACNMCGQWYHAHCQSINTTLYEHHEVLGEDESWYCAICGNPNSRTVFDLHGVEWNSTFSLPDISDNCTTPTDINIEKPIHRSTPTRASQQDKWKKPPLRLLNINFQSSSGKKPEILNLLESTKPDIVVATETWLDSTITDSEIFPSSYKVFRKDRHRHGGGVLIAVQSSLDCSEVTELQEDCELIWARLKLQGRKSLYVCAYYRPDVTDETSLKLFNASLTKASSIQNAHIIVAGDLNFPSWNWRLMKMKPNPTCPKLHNAFIDMLSDFGMEQLVEEPTRRDNTLDLVFTNIPHLIPRVEILPGLSDHDAVFCEINIHPQKRKQLPRLVPLYKSADWEGLKREMEELLTTIENRKDSASTDELWTIFKDALHAAVKKYIPHKQARSKESKPWITPALRRLIRKRDRLYKKMRKQGRQEHEAAYKELRREIQRQLRRSYWEYLNDIFEETDPNPANPKSNQAIKHKRFWTYIKHQKSSNIGVSPLKVDGRLVSDPKEQANVLNNQFFRAFSEGKNYSKEEFAEKCNMPDTDYPILDSVHISVEGVKKILSNLQPGKAPGPDNITPRVLKELSDVIAPILTIIYQSSIDSSKVPSDWKDANVTPIFKKGEQYEPANYRPISLTSVCCKVLEHILTSTIMDHLEHHHILCPEQHGFRRKRSCETQLLEFTHELFVNMAGGKQTDILILDFAKAFDRVNHSLLVHKLNSYGIRGVLNQWISDFLDGRRQAVVINGARSNFIPVQSGVPQGSVLGPCLFLIYINDMPDLLSSPVRLFADDTAVYDIVASVDDQKHLQQNLDKLAEWEKRWDMLFHPKKCVTLPVTRRKKVLQPEYHLHGHTLEVAKSVKYLGVTLRSDLNWIEHITTICSKANKTLGFVRRNLNVSSRRIKEMAYKTYVRPVLEYATTIWDPHTQQAVNMLEAVQRRAARFVMRRYRNTSSVSSMIDELQWPSLEERRRTARLTMLYKIHHDLACVGNIKEQLHLLPSRQRRGHNQQFVIPSCRTHYHLNSFLPRTIKQWNGLSLEVVEANSIDTFVSRASRRE